MPNPHVTRQRIESEVRSALGATLRTDPDGIDLDASIVEDMEATSIDFLDVNFRLESAFGIRLATQLVLDHVEEELGEGTAIDRNNRITPAAAQLLRLHLGDLPRLEPGFEADRVAALVTPRMLANAVEAVLAQLPEQCACDATSWIAEDGAQVTCGSCRAEAAYPDGDELTKRWIHDVQRERQLFATA